MGIKITSEENGQFGMIGTSPAMMEVYGLISKVAPTGKTVLIRGERGTGKEMVARAVVGNNERVDNPFMVLNCAAIPHDLLESELYSLA